MERMENRLAENAEKGTNSWNSGVLDDSAGAAVLLLVREVGMGLVHSARLPRND